MSNATNVAAIATNHCVVTCEYEQYIAQITTTCSIIVAIIAAIKFNVFIIICFNDINTYQMNTTSEVRVRHLSDE